MEDPFAGISLGYDSGVSNYTFPTTTPDIAPFAAATASDPFAGIGLGYTSAYNSAGQSLSGATATSYGSGSSSSGSSSGGSWLNSLQSLLSPINSLTNSVATIIKASNSQPTAGFFDSAGVYHATNSNGVAATSTGAPVTPAGQGFAAGLSSSLNSVMSTVTPLLPWLIAGVVVYIVVKLFRHR